jgi:hypothetical protein
VEDGKVLAFDKSEDRLDEEDKAMFLPVLLEFRAMHERIGQMQAELARHNTETVKKQGVVEYLFNQMRAKYGLSDGDDITAEGVIVRKG